MKPEDIVGKEFTTFVFENKPQLSFTQLYRDMVGLKAIVLNIHKDYPEYANTLVTRSDGTKTEYHYPTQDIIKNIEEVENNIDETVYFKQVHIEIRKVYRQIRY